MSYISEHYTEFEREHSNTENTRVDFLVSSNTIGVYDLLEYSCELVSLEECRRSLIFEVFRSYSSLGKVYFSIV